jgi:formylglycine-generating enzyme required for sulfatase activity
LLAVSLALACLVLTVIAHSTQWHPGGYDEITHLQNARNVWVQLSEPGGAWDALQGRYPTEERPDYWPGLAYIATAPFLSLAPEWPKAPLFFLLLCAALWAGTLIRGAQRLAPGAGELALWLALLGGLPLVTLRHYTPMAWQAALGVLAAAVLVRSDGFRRPGPSLAWGGVVAAGLMSDRLTMATLIWLTPLAALLSRGQWVRRAGGLLLAMAPIALFAGPFYARWLRGWGRALVFGGRADNPGRLGDLATWIPLHGLEPAAAILVGIGLVLALRHRQAVHRVWWAAALSPLPLLSRTEPGQEGLVVYIVGPLAVLAAAGWVRSGWHRRGAPLALVITLWAILGHAGRSGIGPLNPEIADPGIPTARSLDRDLLSWLDKPGQHAVLDLRQSKEGYAGHWTHYLFQTRRPQVPVDWPVRRVQTEYDANNLFVQDPCAMDHVLVIHGERPWYQDPEIRRPLGLMGLKDEQKTAWFAAVQAIRDCTRIAKTLDGPKWGTFTWLERTGPRSPPEPTTAHATNPAEQQGWETPSTADGPCPNDMIKIPGGRYTLGRTADGPEIYALEPTTITTGAFCIDTYEFPNQVDTLPRINVTWQEAQQACKQAGKRLCRSLEWEAACRGITSRRHSYGETFTEGRCFTEGARYYDDRDLRPIGGFPGCATPEGVRDLDGGVSEWVQETHAGPPFPPDGGTGERITHVLRGGTMWTAKYGQDCLSRHWHAQGHRQEDDGFRCCSSPMP